MAQTGTDGLEVLETREWVDSLDYVLSKGGPVRAGRLLQQLALHPRRAAGVNLPSCHHAVSKHDSFGPQPPFPGSQEMERRIKSLVRWNALAMVVRANKIQEGIGGHISTFASAATLYEVAFNHFFQTKTETGDRDFVYFQGHAAPGIYARAYLEGRIPRRKAGKLPPRTQTWRGIKFLSSPLAHAQFLGVPHSLNGLGTDSSDLSRALYPLSRIAGSSNRNRRKIRAFLGDGEMDEPEALGSITLASRENLTT